MKKKKEIKFFTVGDLKKLLENIDNTLPVGVAGHFGEFRPADPFDFWKRASMPKEDTSWKAEDHYSDVFLLPTFDLGPDPD